MTTRLLVVLAVTGCLLSTSSAPAADSFTGPLSLTVGTNSDKTVSWPRPSIPALNLNRLSVGVNVTNLIDILPDNIQITAAGYSWGTSNTQPNLFFRLTQAQLSSNELLSANVLNRLAYGPTPDELARVQLIGPQAYIDEQLAMESIAPANPLEAIITVRTNSVSFDATTNWTSLSVTGSVSSSTLYMYLRGAGDLYLDNVQLRTIDTVVSTNVVVTTNTLGVVETNTVVMTNTTLSPNVLVNGNFEAPLASGWTVSSILAGSSLSTTIKSEGAAGLHMVSSGVGTTQDSSIWQTITPALVNGRRCVLSFEYLPNPKSSLLTIRLSGSGVIISGKDALPPPEWIYVTATGPLSSANKNLYAYLSGAGEGWIDDIRLVAGKVPNVGPNLLVNGDFEQPLGTEWQASPDFAGSSIDNSVAHSGGGSLHLVATGAGAGSGDAVFQTIPSLVNLSTYTVSYWYRPSPQNRQLTVRLSGSVLLSNPDTSAGVLRSRLDAANWGVTLDEMRRWYCQNAAGSPAQLLEVLTQFFENHFVTYHSKTMDYLDAYYDGGILDRIATDLEYREVSRWRGALLNPNCTFYDLLKIHAESPAEIIYLDTVVSRGDGARIANENYARELLELFTMGVDNGYDQNDIVHMSRAWTGWTVDLVDRANINNPLAPRSTQYGQYPGVGFNQVSNIVGVWSFVYNTNWHGTNRQPIFSTWDPSSPATNPVATGPKVVPGRFGPPWAGRAYQLPIPRRTGNAGINDGYDVIRHLSEQPFTAEYLSVKLARVFVHDQFPNPTANPALPEYAFYDYTNPARSAEAELIRQCIVAWDTPGPDGRKGNIRSVLRTIFNSDLFRSHDASLQKVKTPLEFVVSAIRSMRSAAPNGSFTAFTDGNIASQLSRMGGMSLFNRADPDGYPEFGPPWISAGTLAERLRFVQTLCMTGTRPNDAGANTVDPVALLKQKLPATAWNNAGQIADYFLSVLFPGEGAANLDLYRRGAVNFLNTRDDGSVAPAAEMFSALPNNAGAGSVYDTRVRGMVGMLMTLPRFQEQ
ncbi:MAG TPA: DUF1800 family protein [Verrucomicrobiae bacterium]|nr:DUF1800 family protein [Verrucomicrobiae bacterium]